MNTEDTKVRRWRRMRAVAVTMTAVILMGQLVLAFPFFKQTLEQLPIDGEPQHTGYKPGTEARLMGAVALQPLFIASALASFLAWRKVRNLERSRADHP